MNREDIWLHMLDSTAKLQHEIALILEAKAQEAEKSRSWVCHHLTSANVPGHDNQMKTSVEVNEQIIELIDGLTKLESALNRQLQALLGAKEDDGGGSGFGDMMSFGSERG
ncbi:restriction endonuclease subunit S [Paenibacillus athensensis]|uniref:Restriction endonuclease subunit S n=1 Tax=Paenibacillus athensensis TaxID=1967502 RepID=A0A4Y8PRG0_9BACL|nr:restriction endonuclease subunit S [Paenibacillus athensensis]MCD1258101.1 restriction endonuclease subunit S [Paenibacillus athensensis]